MKLNRRRYLCTDAAEYVKELKFFDNYVPEARTYELQFPDRKELTIGIMCPVVPPTFLYQEDSLSPLKMAFIKSPATDYINGRLQVLKEAGNCYSSLFLAKSNYYNLSHHSIQWRE